MADLAQGLGLDLADALARDIEVLSHLLQFVIGLLASFVTAVVAVRFFLSYIRKHSFSAFGVYRIAVACLFAAVLFFW